MRVLKKFLAEVRGGQAQHLTSLAAFIRAIVASGSTQLPKVAKKICDRAAPASREKGLSRRTSNAAVHFETYVLPVAGALVACPTTFGLLWLAERQWGADVWLSTWEFSIAENLPP